MRRGRWGPAFVLAASMVAAACGGGGGSDTGAPEGGPTTVAAAGGPTLAVVAYSQTLVDTRRPTDAVGSTPASPGRTLATVILAPAPGQAAGPFPLIVFAHGSGGRARPDHLLLRSWAAAGYVVAAPTFPFGGGRAGESEAANDYPNQPADMSFVIDEVLRLVGDPVSPLRGMVDPDRIGAAGHSLGGMTALALAGNTCCHDGRVKAAAVLAGRELPFSSGRFWARIATPVLFVHGDADGSVPYPDGRRAYANAPPPRFLVTIEAGDHGRPFTGAADDAQAKVVTAATLGFFDRYLKGVADGLDRLQAGATVAGVSRVEREL